MEDHKLNEYLKHHHITVENGGREYYKDVDTTMIPEPSYFILIASILVFAVILRWAIKNKDN